MERSSKDYIRGAFGTSAEKKRYIQPNLQWEDKPNSIAKDQFIEDTVIDRCDKWNSKLLDNVYPQSWKDATPKKMYNLIVIGAGAGGLTGSLGSIEFGADVALIEAG